MATTPYLSMRVWSDDSKTTEITSAASPIVTIHSVARSMTLNSPYEHRINCELTDPRTGALDRGNYVEVTVGRTSPTMWANGFVMELDKTQENGTMDIVLHSPLLALANINDLGVFVTEEPHYHNVMDVLNGWGDSRVRHAYQKGMLTPAGWTGVWVTGPGWPQQPVGTKGRGRSDWGTVLQNVDALAQIYALYYRERFGSHATNGVLEFGPLSDASGLQIWGGDPLAAKLGLPSGHRAIAAAAQKAGLISISAVGYTATTNNVKNLIWPTGKGTGEKMTTLRLIFGDIFLADGTTLAPGVQAWRPNPRGQIYYVKASDEQTWRGHKYELCAAQQWDGNYAYGVVDRTSAAKYGLIEMWHHWKKATTPELLLSLALGQLEMSSDPPPQWVFGCRHPANVDVPSVVYPGQTVDVQFSGVVHDGIVLGSDGQFHGTGAYTYMSWPNTTDPQAIINVKRVTDVSDTLDANGYVASYTMGHTKKPKSQAMLLGLARAFEEGRQDFHHKFTRKTLDDVPFWLSTECWEDGTSDELWMNPNGIAVSDVPHERFFDDHHQASFTVEMQDPGQCLDFWIAKPVGGTVKQADITGAQVAGLPNGVAPQYALFRLCGAAYNGRCGFFTTTDGVNLTKRGTLPFKRVLDKNGRLPAGVYHVSVSWSGGTWEAHLAQLPSGIPDPVADHNLVALWHDHDKAITTYGAVGFHYLGASGLPSMVLSKIGFHPFRRRSNAGRGGNKGRHATVTHGSDGGVEFAHYGGEVGDQVRRSHRFGHDGMTHQRHEHGHGPYHATVAVPSAVTQSGTTITMTFTAALPKGSLATGMYIYDAYENFAVITALVTNAKGQITGIQSTDPGLLAMGGDTSVFWDPLDVAPGAVPFGHRRTGIWSDLHGGWGIMDVPADGDASKAFITWPDGTHSTLGGAVPLTQDNGDVVSLADLSVGGRHFAKGLEHDGAALFDAGEQNSVTQVANGYPVTVNPLITPTTSIGGDVTAMTDQSQGPTTIPACWVAQTVDGKNGIADAILQLTVGPYAAHTYTTIQWQDTQILEEDGTQRKFTVKHNSSFTFPVYVAVGTTPSALRMGARATAKTVAGSTFVLNQTVSAPGNGGRVQTSVGDTWVVGMGTANQEIGTVSSVDSINQSLIFTGLVHAHVAGELLLLRTTLDTVVGSPTYNTQVPVQSTMVADGELRSDQVQASVDVIAVGFYALDLKANTFDWYRGYWGDPAWQCPYTTPSSVPLLGAIPALSGFWTDFGCKAGQLKNSAGQALYTKGSLGTKVIVGVEIAIFAANPGTGQTVYFDAHEHGNSVKRAVVQGSAINGSHIGSGTLGHRHKNPVQHGDGHHHSDFTFWLDTGNTLHWESGTLVVHDGRPVITINGGSEDTPNTGLSGILSGQSSAAGNYLVFNSTGSAIQLKDATGTVTIPAYSASGGPGGQSTGFGFVSESYNFGARVGGGAVKRGTPAGLFKIGKIEHTPDTYTGELPVKTHHASGKKHGKHQRKGSVGHKHSHPHMQTKHVHKNIVFSVSNSDTGPNAAGFCTVSWTAGTIELNDNATSYPIAAGSVNTVSAGGYLLYDSLTHPTGFTPSTGADFTQDANVKWFQVGKLSTVKDAHTGQYYFHAMHHGSHQTHGSHHAKSSVGRGHQHPHNAPKHQHKDIVFGLTTGSPATLTWGAGTLVDNNGTAIASIAANGTGIAVSANQILYFNGTTYAVANPGAIDFSADANVGLYVVGHFSGAVDASGYLTLYGWHGGVNQMGSSQIRSGAITRKHLNKHHITRGHFVNCTFQMSGGSGINSPVFNLVAHGTGHINFMPSDGTPNIDLGTGTVGVVGPPWPVQSGSNNCQGCIILYNDQATSNVGAFIAVTSGTDLTNDGATIGGLPASQWMKIGHVSLEPDPVTGQYIFHSYLTGTHHNTSVHHAPKSHTRAHSHIHNPHKHHHHGTSFECVGSTFYCNYGTGGVTPTFTSTIQSTDGESYALQPGTFPIVPHDWVYVDISGVANGGNVTPLHANSSSFTPGNTHIVLCRISGGTDANGDYTTEGHHHNAHKKSPHHLKNNAIKSAHITSGAVQTAHIGSGQVQNANVGSGAIHSGNLATQAGVLGVSAVDSFSAPQNLNWSMRNWGGLAPPAVGSLTGGNYGGFTSYMTHYMLEVAVGQDFSGTMNWGAWTRVRVHGRPHAGSSSSDTTIVNDAFWVDSGLSSGNLARIYVQQCDILTDGSMSIVYGYSWQGTGTVNINVKFRAVFNVSS